MVEDAWGIVGGRPLRGSVRPSGSKNGALPTLAATLLLKGETILEGLPRIEDVRTMEELLRAFGLTVEENGGDSVRVVNQGLSTHRAPKDIVSRMRASHYLLGPVAAQLGRAEIPLPGGCDLGARPVDYILAGLEAVGMKTRLKEGRIEVRADHLAGARVQLDPRYRSPGATFNVLMAAALAEGESVIEHASAEPDVVCFCRFLNAAGARIEGAGGPTLRVRGVDALQGVTHRVNPDRLEAGTFLLAGVATRGEVQVEGVARADLSSVVDKLEEAGVTVAETGAGLRAACPGRPRGVTIVTDPYPMFPTDLQPPMAAMLVTADGESRIEESIFDRRLQYVEELVKMGADIELLDSRRARISGVARLRGAEVTGHNIRDGAALLIAALSADGESIVSGRRFVARGYERIAAKLNGLGAQMETLGSGEGSRCSE